jgi:hypothetical protein
MGTKPARWATVWCSFTQEREMKNLVKQVASLILWIVIVSIVAIVGLTFLKLLVFLAQEIWQDFRRILDYLF